MQNNVIWRHGLKRTVAHCTVGVQHSGTRCATLNLLGCKRKRLGICAMVRCSSGSWQIFSKDPGAMMHHGPWMEKNVDLNTTSRQLSSQFDESCDCKMSGSHSRDTQSGYQKPSSASTNMMESVWAVTRAIALRKLFWETKRLGHRINRQKLWAKCFCGATAGPSKVETMPCSAIGPAAAHPKIIHPSPFRCFLLRATLHQHPFPNFRPAVLPGGLFIKRPSGDVFHRVCTVLCPVYVDAQLREQDRGSSDALPRLGLHFLGLFLQPTIPSSCLPELFGVASNVWRLKFSQS